MGAQALLDNRRRPSAGVPHLPCRPHTRGTGAAKGRAGGRMTKGRDRDRARGRRQLRRARLWDRESELPTRVSVASKSPPGAWRAATGESFCVWDMEVLWFERQAYVATLQRSIDRRHARRIPAALPPGRAGRPRARDLSGGLKTVQPVARNGHQSRRSSDRRRRLTSRSPDERAHYQLASRRPLRSPAFGPLHHCSTSSALGARTSE